MTLAVLKNRILNETHREFDQESWGATTFRDFVEQFPEIVRIDRTAKPPLVELLPAAAGDAEASFAHPRLRPLPGRRQPWLIRRDLWNAILDYSSGDSYVWEGGVAVRVPEGQYDANDRRLRLPTVSPDEMRGWRSDFAKRSTTDLDPPEFVAAVNRWRDESLTGKALPARLRGRWVETLKSLVRDRLQEWFDANGVPTPDDLIQRPEPTETPRDDTEQLRSLVIRCVQAMTRAELEELRLPPAVVLRARR